MSKETMNPQYGTNYKPNPRKCNCPNCKSKAWLEDWYGWRWCFKHWSWRWSGGRMWYYLKTTKIF